mmetsp:Transcript_48531/g.113613  ORF Transcript_48531/g.113613 Transcript_48531/m.113613 type:complete len:226 (-) Transcript_48531:122-799(-)
MEEIERCARSSPHFNFLLLLGDRYGYRPLTDALPPAEYEKLLAALTPQPAAARLMREWYALDPNALPPTVALRKLDDATRAAFWREALPVLGPALRAAARALHASRALSAASATLSNLPVTEQEMLQGLFTSPASARESACFSRSIHGWTPTGSASHRFQDVSRQGDGSLLLDGEAAAMRTSLRKRVKAFICKENYWAHDVHWQADGGGISSDHLPSSSRRSSLF